MPSASVWSHLNHFASEWIGEVKKFIAGIKDLFDLSFERARRFHLEGQPTPAPQEGAPGRLLTSLRGQRSCQDANFCHGKGGPPSADRASHILLLALFVFLVFLRSLLTYTALNVGVRG